MLITVYAENDAVFAFKHRWCQIHIHTVKQRKMKTINRAPEKPNSLNQKLRRAMTPVSLTEKEFVKQLFMPGQFIEKHTAAYTEPVPRVNLLNLTISVMCSLPLGLSDKLQNGHLNLLPTHNLPLLL